MKSPAWGLVVAAAVLAALAGVYVAAIRDLVSDEEKTREHLFSDER